MEDGWMEEELETGFGKKCMASSILLLSSVFMLR